MAEAITKTNFNFVKQKGLYVGKVRDVYNIDDKFLVMVVTDRISCFDIVLPKGIPYKGQVLNQIASKFLDATADIVPNWKIESPDPMVTVGHFARPFKVEMVIRGYLAGHAWREYRDGKRTVSGAPMPEGMVENQKFPEPIITPTTKADEGHDLDISREEILLIRLVSEEVYNKKDGKIYLIDEINTPDSSRYFYLDGYIERLKKGESQKQLSKEFVRQWLIERNFQGKEGQIMPQIPDEFVNEVTERYIELYENIIGEKFVKEKSEGVLSRIESNVSKYLGSI